MNQRDSGKRAEGGFLDPKPAEISIIGPAPKPETEEPPRERDNPYHNLIIDMEMANATDALLGKGAAALRQRDSEAMALEEILDGIREELGLENTHYLVIEDQVSDVIRLLKETAKQMSSDVYDQVTDIAILWSKDSTYPQSEVTYQDQGGDEHKLVLGCPRELKK